MVAKNRSKLLLEDVLKDKLNFAFEYVSYDNFSPDMPHDDAKNVWVKRIETLREEGTYLKEYKDLKIWITDGNPHGEVTIVMIVKGKEMERREEIIFSRSSEDQYWKVQNFFPEDGSDQNVLEHALGGDISFEIQPEQNK
ncbi:hypothetical protein [Effusibacillus consociatus]|uniref:Uncharacterized protein n=1 Tax=Effusibacillus consociatus TaxID=1117041 RepID=A0ABV9Q3Y0_9BACL